jgi:hypothetical protein
METITEDAEEFPQDNEGECLRYRMVEALNEISLEGAESVSGILESISEEDSAVGVDLGGHPEYEPRCTACSIADPIPLFSSSPPGLSFFQSLLARHLRAMGTRD